VKTYAVHSTFLTLQGEGYWTGRRAVFLRFSVCNLWNGREEDRATAVCKFCDTDFVGGERMTAPEIAGRAAGLWGPGRNHRFVVLTGGEPSLQVDWDLVSTLHRFDFFVAMETNGTRPIDPLTDWITVSPKAGAELVQRRGHELKLVYPQAGAEPERYVGLNFQHRFLSPLDDANREANTRAAAEYCLAHPEWRLTLQSHKIVGLP
jgi:7-carboxy-7-deazaguanine synthase